ncbi:hypothetical protein M422DRAFT_240918 [Sphaerobolus stellatus SS14]|nr:hypothetical protein M422DRAFT_240918 [Sphaerobolus stellatus SS14]
MASAQPNVELFLQFKITQYMSIAAFVLYFYDYLITLPMEIERIWWRKRSLGKWLFLLLRYTTPLEMLLYLDYAIPFLPVSRKSRFVFVDLTGDDQLRHRNPSKRYVKHPESLFGIKHCSIKDPIIMITLSGLTKLRVDQGSCIARGPNGNDVYITIFWWHPMIADTLVFFATIYRIHKLRAETGQTSSISQSIIKNGTLYYVVMCILNLFNLIVFKILSTPLNMLGFNIGFVFTTNLTCRFALNLQGLVTPEQDSTLTEAFTTQSYTYTTDFPTAASASHTDGALPYGARRSFQASFAWMDEENADVMELRMITDGTISEFELVAVALDKYMCLAPLVLLVYDHVLTFPLEVERIWKRKLTAPTVLYLILRYVIPFAPALSLIAIMAIRTLALYNCDIRLMVILLIFLSAQFITMLILSISESVFFSSATQTKDIKGMEIIYIPILGCIPNEDNGFIDLFWWSPLGLDTIIFVLTVWRLWHLGQRTPGAFRKEALIQVLLRDGFLYYAVICTINVVNVINTFAGPKSTRPFGVNLSTVMACRLVLNLQGIQPQPSEESGDEDSTTELAMTSLIYSQPPPLSLPPTRSFRFTGERWNILRWREESFVSTSKGYAVDAEDEFETGMAMAGRSLDFAAVAQRSATS